MAQWLPRRRGLKSVDNWACLYYKLTNEPKGSGELKLRPFINKMALYRSEYLTSDPRSGAIFYLRAVIWTSQLDISAEASSQLAFWFRRRGSLWRPSWVSNHNNFSYFWSTSHPIVCTKFPLIWPYESGTVVQNRLSRWLPSWISDCNNFNSFFLSKSHLDNMKFRVN